MVPRVEPSAKLLRDGESRAVPALTPGSPTPFDAQAAEFDRRVGLPEADCRAIAAAVLDLGGAGAGDRVIEIGAGTGLIGAWMASHPARVRYLGLDLSRGMLEVFRRRTGAGPARLVQADGARTWPLADGSTRLVFSSRAIHLLPLAHVVDELFRVGVAGGAACVLGWVERAPESVKARMSREMQRRLRERGFAPRTAGSRRLMEACRARGAVELPRRVVRRWTVRQTPAASIAQWRSKPGIGGIVLPPGVQEEVLGELEAWARGELGGLSAGRESEEAFVLEGVRLPARRQRGAETAWTKSC
jgi:ubiquinone/menaquinone biosynthesis C-methylase UbiE